MALLENHIAVITGAGCGIGRAIATGYAREGAHVVLLDLNEKMVAEAAQEIHAVGGAADSFELDVTQREDCFSLAKQVEEKIGPVSILVNNAGINRRNPFTADRQVVLEDWNNIMSINLNGVFNVTQAFLPSLRKIKGRIVNIGSIQSFIHVRTPNSPAYTTSKHAILGFTRALAAELGKDGVRVNAIGPGLIKTTLNEQMRSNNPEVTQAFMDRTPLGRAGTPDDVTGPAIFLASDLSSYVTGSMVMTDGGYLTI